MVTAIIPPSVANREFSYTFHESRQLRSHVLASKEIAPAVLSQAVLQNELSQLDQRIFSYVVLGRVLQAAGAALFIGSITVGFVATPIAWLGVIPAVALIALGTCLLNQQEESKVYPYVLGQPVGLDNHGNDCWVNASVQLIKNVPALEARARGHLSRFAALSAKYDGAQADKERVAHSINTKDLRKQLSLLTGGIISSGSSQEDAADLFGYILGAPNFFYTLAQQMNGRAAAPRQEAMLSLYVDRDREFNFIEAFRGFFNTVTEEGHAVRSYFITSPQDLVVQLKRFYQFQKPSGESGRGKIQGNLLVPAKFTMPGEVVLTGGLPEYECTGFIEHIGVESGGHYVAYVKKGVQWWLCNDSYVAPVSDALACAAMQRAYIYHFRRC